MNTFRSRVSVVLLSLVIVASVQAAERIRIVSEGGLDKDWVPAGNAPLAKAAYPAQLKDRSRDICVNLGYQVNKDGSTSDFSVMRAWSSENPEADAAPDAVDAFVQSAAAAVSQWRFERTPAASKNSVAYTSATLAFVGDKGGDAEQLRQRCAIPDLRSFITKAQNDAFKRGDVQKARLENYQRENPAALMIEANNAARQGNGP